MCPSLFNTASGLEVPVFVGEVVPHLCVLNTQVEQFSLDVSCDPDIINVGIFAEPSESQVDRVLLLTETRDGSLLGHRARPLQPPWQSGALQVPDLDGGL